VPYLGDIPIDPAIVVGGDAGVPIVAADPDSLAAQAFFELAAAIMRRLERA